MSIPDPIVLLDARAKYVHPAFQMTRASTKTVFDSTGKLVTVPANALGWDHDPATGRALGYLSEQSATNLLLHSNDLTQSSWTAFGSSITGDAITGPDGSGMAKLVENNAQSTHHINQTVAISSGQTIAVQCIAKAAERSIIWLQAANSSNIANRLRCAFDLQAGTAGGDDSAGDGVMASRGILALGDGFYLCWISGTLGDATGCNARMWLGDESLNYQGDGTSGLYLGYCQAEVGSYPTSYIETGAETAMRAGDNLVLSGLGDFPWWRSERGTLLVEADVPPAPFNIASQGQLWMFGGSSQFRLTVLPNGGLQLRGGNFSTIVVSNNISESYNKIAVTWDVDDEVVVSHNGGIDGAGAWTGVFDFLGLGIGVNPGSSGVQQLTFPVLRVVYYPQRISNADLQSLTAIQE